MITGATGFIGRHLLEDLKDSGLDIVVITRDPEKRFPFLPPGTKVIKADLLDPAALRAAFAGASLIIHTAAEIKDSAVMEATNVRGTQNLVAAAIDQKVRRIIHLSSVGVVGEQFSAMPVSVTEVASCLPKNDYERSKLRSEQILEEADRRGAIQVQILRPTNVYGEHHPQDVMLGPILHVLYGKPLPVTIRSVVNYVYVKDLTAVMIRLIKENGAYGVINVGEAQQIREFYAGMEHELGVKARWIVIPVFLVKFIDSIGIRKLRPVTNAVAYDDSKLKKIMDYPYGSERGLKRMIDHYRSKGKVK